MRCGLEVARGIPLELVTGVTLTARDGGVLLRGCRTRPARREDGRRARSRGRPGRTPRPRLRRCAGEVPPAPERGWAAVAGLRLTDASTTAVDLGRVAGRTPAAAGKHTGNLPICPDCGPIQDLGSESTREDCARSDDLGAARPAALPAGRTAGRRRGPRWVGVRETYVDQPARRPATVLGFELSARNGRRRSVREAGKLVQNARMTRLRLSPALLAVTALWAGLAADAAAQGSAATDRAALEALYDTTGGPDWGMSRTLLN